MKVAVISLTHHDDETKAERIKRVLKIINENSGADLYLLPELWNTGFFSFESYAELSEDFYGVTLSSLADAAREHNAYIFTGSFIEKRKNSLFNTAALLDRKGSACGRYSKIHLFGREKEFLSRGESVCVCDTEFGKCGLSVCYDLRFGNLYSKMTDMGADIFLNCSAWPKSRAEHWDILNRARALENQALWLSCCVSGTNAQTELAGTSYAVMPDGGVILKAETECETTELDTESVKKYREEFPVLKDRISL